MLQYLVTSKVRRRLLLLLWAEEKHGSVSELADLAAVSFASAHAELKTMQRGQLVSSRREGAREVFVANFDHPEANALRDLVRAETSTSQPASTEEDQTVKRSLVALGAPLRGLDPLPVPPAERMSMLVRGATLARRDPVVARSLPLCFWKLRESLDIKALGAAATRAEDKHAVGFFLELAGELGGDRRLGGLAENLRDRRMTSVRDFFQGTPRVASRDFPLATKWGFQMNMDEDAFRSLFHKFVRR